MSTTPLMSEYPVDKKEVSVAELPVYAINESDVELVVGQPAKRQCFWGRLRNHCAARRAARAQKQRSPLRRAIRWLLTMILILGVSGFFVAKHQMHKHMKMHPIVCTPITDISNTTLELPLASWKTKIGLHPSLTGGDVKITHSDEVKDGTVQISFTLPEKTELARDDEDPKYFACSLSGPRFVGAGVHGDPHKKLEHGKVTQDSHHRLHKSDDKEHPHPHPHPHHRGIKAISTVVTLPASELGKSRAVSLLGWFHHRFGKKCMKHRIRKAIAKAVQAARAERFIKIEHSDVE